MTTTAQQVKSTPMAPYIGLMRGMSRHDIQIVVTFLNEVMDEAEETKAAVSSDRLVEMARKKFNVPESPRAKWFREHAHPTEWNKQEEWDKLTPAQKAYAKQLKLSVEDMDPRTVGLLIKYAK